MRNAEYWQKRFDLLQASLLNKGIEYYNNLSVQYDKASLSVQKEIEAFYQRFADNNKMDLFEARKLLNTRQLKEFRWSVEEYIEKGETLNYSDQWAKELENASTRHRVTRLQAMQLQMQQQVEALMGNEADGLDNLISDIHEDGYYRTIFEVQKGVGVGESFATLDTDKISKVISKPWATDGTNFSERVWGERRASLVQSLNSDFVQTIIRGDAPDKLIKKIADDFGVAKYKAKRLVLTESSFFSSESHKDAYKELGVEEVKILATLDIGTCSDCGERDGEKIPMSMYETGVTVPPFHPNCKCTTAPVDDFEDGIESYRAARDENGKYYEVPDSMTYKQWKEKYVDGDLTKSKNNDKIVSKGDSMSLEYQRYGRDKDTAINHTYINSGEYRRKFDKITDNEDVNRVLYQKAKEMLVHRSGTLYEDMYWIDADTGKVVASALNEKETEKIVYTKGIKDAIADKTNLITMHTHPQSMPPSASDFNSLLKNNYILGIILCHDGKIFAYKSSENIDIGLYDMYIQSFIMENCSNYDAQIKALQKLQNNVDFSFWEVC